MWHVQSVSFRASSHFLLQKMLLFAASKNDVLTAFTSMSKKTFSFPRNNPVLQSPAHVEGRAPVPCHAPGPGGQGRGHGELKCGGRVPSVSYSWRISAFYSLGWLISEDGRKQWGHHTSTASIGELCDAFWLASWRVRDLNISGTSSLQCFYPHVERQKRNPAHWTRPLVLNPGALTQCY